MGSLIAEQVFNGVMMASVYALIATGLVLIFGVMRVFNFAHGEFVMVGAYVTTFVFAATRNYFLAILAAMAALAVMGVIAERAVFRRLRSLHGQVIAASGLLLFFQNLAVLLWGPHALRTPVPYRTMIVNVLGFTVSVQRLLVVGISLVIMLLLFLFLHKTRLGTAIRATAQSQDAAYVVGIDVDRVHVVVFAISAALAGLAGALIGPLFLTYPTMGSLPLLKGLAAVIVGGMDSIVGAILASLLIGITESISTMFISSGFKDAVAFFMLVVVLVVRPRGIFGSAVRGE